MSTYTESDRLMTVTTPLGGDALLLTAFTGQEALSQLYSFHLDLIAPNDTDVAFDRLLGREMTIHLVQRDGSKRHFSGICARLSESARDEAFTSYRGEIVPQFWLLQRKAQSRIFQQVAVPDILKKVLDGMDVTYELQATYYPRDYCVQYRETDFNFASRLMEEEGIYYYFKHSAGGHTMVVADTPESQPDVPGPSDILYEGTIGGTRDEDRITDWAKTQELRSGKYTLWDHTFELPHKHLEADKETQASVAVGTVDHKLNVGNNARLELYDFPGEYAQRYDGIDPGGGERPSDLQHIFEDNRRTVGLRMEQEAAPALVIRGSGNCRQFVAGHAFSLRKHFNADGKYLITAVWHAGRLPENFRAGGGGGGNLYENHFTCMPFALPYRPARTTPKPVVPGTQSAVVVGPEGEEIFTDKYGRVKVQFHWDRDGKNDVNSSCWLRVGTFWAGNQWGAIHIPRIGQEVLVAFQEGDPDQPLIAGSVTNPDMMPPYRLPDHKTMSVIKSHSTPDGAPNACNELSFEDEKDSEDIYFFAQKDFHRIVKNDDDLQVGDAQTIQVENKISVTAGTSNTKQKPTGYGGGGSGGLGDMAGDAAGAVGALDPTAMLTKGTIALTAGEWIELKVGQSSIKLDQFGITITAPLITIGTPMLTEAITLNSDAITIGMMGTTAIVAINSDMIEIGEEVLFVGMVNFLGEVNFVGLVTIDAIPGPYIPIPI